MSKTVQDMLRDPPIVMILDMGLGSREQSLPVQSSKSALATPAEPNVANDR